jgi:hypothetical protein
MLEARLMEKDAEIVRLERQIRDERAESESKLCIAIEKATRLANNASHSGNNRARDSLEQSTIWVSLLRIAFTNSIYFRYTNIRSG